LRVCLNPAFADDPLVAAQPVEAVLVSTLVGSVDSEANAYDESDPTRGKNSCRQHRRILLENDITAASKPTPATIETYHFAFQLRDSFR
jgi:hypothetical protein